MKDELLKCPEGGSDNITVAVLSGNGGVEMNKKMTIPEAIKIITAHQEWRMGAEIPMLDPKLISEAMYIVLTAATSYRRME